MANDVVQAFTDAKPVSTVEPTLPVQPVQTAQDTPAVQPGQPIEKPIEQPISIYDNPAPDALQARPEEQPEPDFDFGEAWAAGRELESVGGAILRMAGKPELEPDPEFVFTEEQWIKATEGVRPEFQHRLFDAQSEAEMTYRKERILQEQAAQDVLSKYGWKGTATQFATAMFDETALAALVASEGLAAPWIAGAKAYRLGRLGRAALVGGATNAGVEGFLYSQNETKSPNDILYAGIFGAVLGAPFAKGVRGDAFVDASTKLAKEVENDSIGAARTAGSEVEAGGIDIDDAPSKNFFEGEAPEQHKGWISRARFDTVGRMLQSEIPTTRKFASQTGENAVEGGASTAALEQLVDQDMLMTRFTREAVPSLQLWLKEKGSPPLKRADDTNEFYELVGRAVRGEAIDNPHITRAAKAIQQNNADLLELVKKSGVEGFEEVIENPNYLTRMWSGNKFTEFNIKYHSENTVDFLKKAIIAGSDDIAEQYAEKLAKAIFKRFTRKDAHLDDLNNNKIFGKDKLNNLETLLKEMDVGEDEIESILFTMKKGTGEKAKPVRARKRISLDETYRDKINGEDVSIADLMDNNAMNLHARYVREMTGRAAMAKHGIKSDRDFDKVIEQIRAEAALRGIKSEKDVEHATFLYNSIIGKPLEANATSKTARAARFMRDWNFVRIMNQTGFAQLAEIGNITGQLGWKATISHVPDLRRMIKRMENGRLEHELLAEMEDMIGAFGNDRLIHQANLRFDEYGEGLGKKFEGVDNALQYAKRVTADISGMAPVNIGLQRMTAVGISQKFLNLALDPSKANMKRLKTLGLDDEMLGRVLGQINKHSESTKNTVTKRKLKKLNLEQWVDDDPEALQAFRTAVNRWSHRIVQKNIAGEDFPLMHSTLGKVMMQFRSFMLVAHAKQLLHNVRMNDFETYATAMFTTFFGGMAYSAQTYINSFGRDDQREYLKKRLAPTEIGKAAFQRSGMSSLIPGVIDTGASLVGDPLFAYGRSTGLATGFLNGNPTVDLVNKASRTTQSITKTALRDDFDWSKSTQRDLWGLMMFSNAIGMRNINELMMGDLPKNSE